MMTQSLSPSEEVGPTEEVVKALLEYLVDPLLPLKPSANAPPPPLSQQQHVAKQLHAVVLLYNYYHKKHHPKAEYLDLVSFSKLVVALKPALVAYMKSAHASDFTDENGLENQLSVTEKAILDACNISLSLEVSRDVPSIDGWPISKVAVLLVDSSKENCFLLFSSTTDGIWSVIEKGVDHSSTSPENQAEGKRLNKRKRNSKRQSTSEQNADESAFQQLAFSAVKEATGIDRSDLMVLERHLTYSLSKEKTSACFYIMQCTQSTNQEFQVPLGDTIESLQGPLVKRSAAGWTNTQVIEYYHMLPYAKIMSSWFSRELSPTSLQSPKASTMENIAEKEVSESGNLVVDSLQNSILELGDMEIQRSSSTENPFQQMSNEESYTNMENIAEKEVSESGNLVVESLQNSILELGDMEIQRSSSTENPFQQVSNEESYTYANSSGQEDSGVKRSKRTNKEVGTRSCDVDNIFGTRITEGRKDDLHGSQSANVKETAVNVSGSQMSETLYSQGLKEEMMDISVSDSQNAEASGDREANGKSSSCRNSCHVENPSGVEVNGVSSSQNVDKEVEKGEKSDKICKVSESRCDNQISESSKLFISASQYSNVVTEGRKDYSHGPQSANVKEKAETVSGSQMSETLCSQGLKEEMMDINVCGSQNAEASGDREANGKSSSCRKSCSVANPSDVEVNGASTSQNEDNELEKGEKSDKICKVSESRCDNQINESSKLFISVSQNSNVVTEGRTDYLHGSQSANVKEMTVTVSGSQMSETLCSQGLKEELIDINVKGSQNTDSSGDGEANEKSSGCSKSGHSANASFVNSVSSSQNVDKEVEKEEKSNRICKVSESSESSKFLLSVSQNTNVVMDLQSTEQSLLKEVIRDRSSTDSIAKEASGVNRSQGTKKEVQRFAESSDVTEISCQKEITESKTAPLDGVQDSCIESEYLEVDDARRTEDLIGMEIDEHNYSFNKNSLLLETEDPCANEASATIISQIRDKEVENRDRSDERLAITGFTSKESSGVKTDSAVQKDNTVTIANCLSLPLREGMDDFPVTFPKDEDKIMNRKTFRVYHHRKRTSTNSDTQASVGGANVELETAQSMKSGGTECRVDIANNSSAIISLDQHGVPLADHALVPIEPSANIDKGHSVLVLKETELSQAALRVLSQKREKLSNQQREIEDQIALCEKSIQRILDGNEDNLGLKIDTIIDCCSEVLFKDKTQVRGNSHQQAEGRGPIQCLRAKRLSEAVLFGQYACQELDDICCENNWFLPKYVVSASDGGFLANVTLKGMDFESSCESVPCSTPRGARESAAAQMITKLRAMASQTL